MQDSIAFKIKSRYAGLRKSEKQVADIILQREGEAEAYSLVELCEAAGVSQPTVIRFTKALGFDGYKSFRDALIKNNAKEAGVPFEPLYGFEVRETDRIGDVPRKAIATTIGLLQDTLQYIPAKDYEAAVRLMKEAHIIDIYCVENSNATACDLLNKLLYLGLTARYFQDSYLQQICAGHLKNGDVAIGISYTGSSLNTVEALKTAKQSGAKTIAITNHKDSPVLQYADIQICASNESALIYGNAIFSRSTQIALVDMLYMGLILSDYRRFSKALDLSGELVRDREIKG